MLSKVQIKEVKTKADRRLFVDLPNRLYRDNDNFVPAFYGDDLADWDEKKTLRLSIARPDRGSRTRTISLSAA